MKISKNRYLQGFGITVCLLALVRCVFPQVAESQQSTKDIMGQMTEKTDDIAAAAPNAVTNTVAAGSKFIHPDGTLVKNRIYSVSSFRDAFPDNNDVQLAAAQKWGVAPVRNREDAESRKKELVYMGSNPYYHVDKLNNSIPYLVPRAAVLLQSIGRNFFDSLQIKGIPLHKIIVTSVLRTQDDVVSLRSRNGNATENSCHLYGTTFDICYNRYKTVEDPNGPSRRSVRNDTLKWVLSEVLRDMRCNGHCYIKYEVKQGCFHMTVN